MYLEPSGAARDGAGHRPIHMRTKTHNTFAPPGHLYTLVGPSRAYTLWVSGPRPHFMHFRSVTDAGALPPVFGTPMGPSFQSNKTNLAEVSELQAKMGPNKWNHPCAKGRGGGPASRSVGATRENGSKKIEPSSVKAGGDHLLLSNWSSTETVQIPAWYSGLSPHSPRYTSGSIPGRLVFFPFPFSCNFFCIRAPPFSSPNIKKDLTSCKEKFHESSPRVDACIKEETGPNVTIVLLWQRLKEGASARNFHQRWKMLQLGTLFTIFVVVYDASPAPNF